MVVLSSPLGYRLSRAVCQSGAQPTRLPACGTVPSREDLRTRLSPALFPGVLFRLALGCAQYIQPNPILLVPSSAGVRGSASLSLCRSVDGNCSSGSRSSLTTSSPRRSRWLPTSTARRRPPRTCRWAAARTMVNKYNHHVLSSCFNQKSRRFTQCQTYFAKYRSSHRYLVLCSQRTPCSSFLVLEGGE